MSDSSCATNHLFCMSRILCFISVFCASNLVSNLLICSWKFTAQDSEFCSSKRLDSFSSVKYLNCASKPHILSDNSTFSFSISNK
uniref:Uncharacterized protein n=1 Tax=Rhizophora mucronata TaxID=61149 RepID=A0A2P2KTZ4_RHIMU